MLNPVTPSALFITCVDARIVPGKLFDTRPGEWLTLRTIANIIPPYWQTEISVASTLELAVKRVKVKQIIVCGHTDCAGIHALDEQIDLAHEPGLARWVDIARPGHTPNTPHPTLVEQNVRLQLQHLRSYPYIRTAEAQAHLTLHGWVYHLETGQVHRHNPATNQFETPTPTQLDLSP